MTVLALNIHLWKHLLLRVEFDSAVDHKAPELDDFLLPHALGDQITDSTLMHRYICPSELILI